MPSNYAEKKTDKELASLERKLSMLYAESKADLDVAVDRYYNGYDEIINGKSVHHAGMTERYEKEKKAYEAGKYHDPTGQYTDEEMFMKYVWAQEGRGKQLEQMRDQMARQMTETNQRAAAMINDKTPGIYSLNANWEAYKIEAVRKTNSGKIKKDKTEKTIQGNKFDIAFNLINEQTIKELAQDKNHVEFRVNSVNPVRDYEWNRDQINKALTAGILQGDSPYEVANRYLTVMKRNQVAAIRNARTSITSAQNAGCQRTYERAAEMGIKLRKQWMSTADERTRDSHLEMNGEIVDIDSKFSNDLMYPGDAEGAPAEVYNCRCTMVTVDPALLGVNADPYDVVGFEKWVNEKRRRGQ